MDEEFEFTPPTPIRRGGPKSPGAGNLKLHVENMNEQQLEQALETINENPTTTTIIDNNGNENYIKTEINEIPNTSEINSNNNQPNRRSSRLKTNNPIVRFENPLFHKRLQETPLTKSKRNSPSHSE